VTGFHQLQQLPFEGVKLGIHSRTIVT
jgi:hypothetical protein